MSNPWTVQILDPLRLDLQDTDTSVRAVVLDPIRYTLDRMTPSPVWTLDVVVPAGFVSDLATIPRPLWWIPGFSPFDRIAEPSVLHDWLYFNGHALGLTRADADNILAAAMAEKGEGPIVRGLVWSGVRLGGAIYWNGGI